MAKGPILRFTLARLGLGRHQLLITHHHILLDGWSIPILLEELLALYQDPSGSRLPPVTPYRDYLAWLQQQDGEAALLAWEKALAGLVEPTILRPDAGLSGAASQRLDVSLSSEISAALGKLARSHGVTLNTVLQVGWGLLLARQIGHDDVVFGITVSGRPPELPGIERMIGLFINTVPLRLGAGTDIVLGTPVAGRTDAALEELVGFFVNTLVLRTDVAGDPSVRELLARVRETDLAAYSHQDLPFERLVEAINPTRSMGRHPLFQVMLALQQGMTELQNLPELSVSANPIDIHTTKFDLSVDFAEHRDIASSPAGLDGFIEYATDLFDRSTVEGLGARLVRVLEAMTADPDQAINRLELLAPEERRAVLVDWNDTTRLVPSATLPELFEVQARATPDAIALLFEERQLTYAELDAAANRGTVSNFVCGRA